MSMNDTHYRHPWCLTMINIGQHWFMMVLNMGKWLIFVLVNASCSCFTRVDTPTGLGSCRGALRNERRDRAKEFSNKHVFSVSFTVPLLGKIHPICFFYISKKIDCHSVFYIRCKKVNSETHGHRGFCLDCGSPVFQNNMAVHLRGNCSTLQSMSKRSEWEHIGHTWGRYSLKLCTIILPSVGDWLQWSNKNMEKVGGDLIRIFTAAQLLRTPTSMWRMRMKHEDIGRLCGQIGRVMLVFGQIGHGFFLLCPIWPNTSMPGAVDSKGFWYQSPQCRHMHTTAAPWVGWLFIWPDQEDKFHHQLNCTGCPPVSWEFDTMIPCMQPPVGMQRLGLPTEVTNDQW